MITQNGEPSPSGIGNMYCELPDTLPPADIGFALLEIHTEISGIAEPPVANVATPYVNFEPPLNATIEELEDYRRFYVEFHDHASEQDVHAAVTIVMRAISRLRK